METNTSNINIQRAKTSRISELDKDNIQFGKIYSDHMLVADYEDGEWKSCEIMPFGNMSIHPATTFIHYGQSIFEGIKAYKNEKGEVLVFRHHDNWKRMNISAERMCLPPVPEEYFMEGIAELLRLDKNWIPDREGTSLYIRPFLFATNEYIGIKTPTKFRFMIITSPAGPYYSEAVSIYVQDKYFRAFPGGTGYAKAAGNYGGVMYPTKEVQDMGFNQILWLDGIEKKYVQEIGTMNIFFKIGDTVITPNLDGGTILDGITRRSVLELLEANGIPHEVRPITIDEIVEAGKNGQLKEAFGAGTAASIAPIGRIASQTFDISLPDVSQWETGPWLKDTLNNIRYGKQDDKFGWVTNMG